MIIRIFFEAVKSRCILLPFFGLLIATASFGQSGSIQNPDPFKDIRQMQFVYDDIEGIGYEKGCTRRDPSDIILVDNTFYIYYTKVYGKSPGYWGTIWCASSQDQGFTWKEEGEVLGIGDEDAFDSQATFTPNIIKAHGKYYLFYTGVKPTPGRSDGVFENNSTTDITAIGLAVSNSPTGPFKRINNNPVLEVSDHTNHFDSYRIDDASLIYREGKYWLYYKGRSRLHGKTGPSQTKMGLAFSDNIEGPYEKHGKHILAHSHEVLIWPYDKGIMTLASISSTLEYAENGIDFTTKPLSLKINDRPNAPGAFRPELTQLPLDGTGIQWGISMIHNRNESYLIRFEIKIK